MSSFEKDLPKTWVLTNLGEVYRIVGGGTPSTDVKEYWGGDVPWITSADIEGVRKIKIRKHVTEKGIDESATNKVPAKTLLVVTRVGLGKIAIAESPICFSQDVQGLIQDPDLIVPEYTLYLLSYELQILKFKGRGTTISGVTKKQLKDLSFPLPPVNEQRRIVAKIEELFSELAKGIENLKLARAQLKIHRRALLKDACEGRLTKQWREENRGKKERPGVVRERIHTEREQHYEKQLASWHRAIEIWEVSGKKGRKPQKPNRPKPMPAFTTDQLDTLPSLPESWAWMKYGDLCWRVRNGISAKPEGDVGLKIFRISAVRPMFFDMDDYRFIDDSRHEYYEYYLERGDLVFTRYNGSRQYVGVCAEYKSDELRLFPDKLIQTQGFSGTVRPSYLEKVLNGGASRKFIEQKIRTTAGQSGVSGGDIRSIPVPICAPQEQQMIIDILEAQLSVISETEKQIEDSLQMSGALRQSILNRAFSGLLVPPDPNDEPASVLLERIKVEKAAQARRNSAPETGYRKEALRKKASV